MADTEVRIAPADRCGQTALADIQANTWRDADAPAKAGELLAIKERRSELPHILALLQARKALCYAFSEL